MQHQHKKTDHRHNTLVYTILVAGLLWTDTRSGFVLSPSSAVRTERSEKLNLQPWLAHLPSSFYPQKQTG